MGADNRRGPRRGHDHRRNCARAVIVFTYEAGDGTTRCASCDGILLPIAWDGREAGPGGRGVAATGLPGNELAADGPQNAGPATV